MALQRWLVVLERLSSKRAEQYSAVAKTEPYILLQPRNLKMQMWQITRTTLVVK